MKKIALLVLAVALLYFGFQSYQKKKADGQLGALAVIPTITTDNNSEVSDGTNVELHCIPPSDINQITNLNFALSNEVYTASVKQLNCSYENVEVIDNLKPTVTYKVSLFADANGVWSRKQDALKSDPSYAVSSDYPDAFADLNPVKALNQGTFYGHKDNKYVELTYTPVTEGQTGVFMHGMQILQKVMNN